MKLCRYAVIDPWAEDGDDVVQEIKQQVSKDRGSLYEAIHEKLVDEDEWGY